MISGLDASSEQFLSSISRVQERLDRAQKEIASGLRVTTASDAPADIADILQLKTDLVHVDQVKTNLSAVSTEVDTAERGLDSGIQLLEDAKVIAARATGTLQTSDTRTGLADQVDGILQQMVSLSRVSVEGRYVFSGDQDGSPAYTQDAAGNVVRLLTGQSVTRQFEDSGGSRFSIGRTAQDIFDHRNPDDSFANDNVFQSLVALSAAIRSGDQTAMSTAIGNLDATHSYLNLQQQFYGTAQARLSREIDTCSNSDVSLKSQIADKREADLAQSTVELTQARTQLEAALQAKAKAPQTSLFDYLG